jgi:hypothetical protein
LDWRSGEKFLYGEEGTKEVGSGEEERNEEKKGDRD